MSYVVRPQSEIPDKVGVLTFGMSGPACPLTLAIGTAWSSDVVNVTTRILDVPTGDVYAATSRYDEQAMKMDADAEGRHYVTRDVAKAAWIEAMHTDPGGDAFFRGDPANVRKIHEYVARTLGWLE